MTTPLTTDPVHRAGTRSLVALLLILFALGIGVALVEVGLRWALNPADFLQATMVEDPVLGSRIAPGTSGHDARGYRNKQTLATARVVALGDSHTYGVSAPRDGSWPQHLSQQLGEPVYNLGLGGFGPLQYLHLAKTHAKELKSQVWVVGYYFGNDLMDAYYVAHGRPYWHAWRQSSGQPSVEPADAGAGQEPVSRVKALRNWLARNSMLYSVLRATVGQRFAAQERAQAVEAASADVSWAWADPAANETRTIFKPLGRLHAVDLDRPAVAEGLQIGQRALFELHAEAARQGARLIVVLIPTKERAYCAYLKATSARMPAAHVRLCDAELRAKEQLVMHLTQQRIEHADATPALESRIAQHEQLYPRDDDGHELSAGYAVIAQVAAAALARPKPVP